jgi:hypothetical protein
MVILLTAQLAELGGLFGIVLGQAVGEILIDARIYFLERDAPARTLPVRLGRQTIS